MEQQRRLGCSTSMQGPSSSQPPPPSLSALGPAAMFAFSTPHSGGHETQCNFQPRVGKRCRGAAASGVSLETEQEGLLSARLLTAASSLSWTPVVYWRLATGCLTRASCPPVTSLCVCLSHCPMANVIPLLTAVSACSIVLHFCTY